MPQRKFVLRKIISNFKFEKASNDLVDLYIKSCFDHNMIYTQKMKRYIEINQRDYKLCLFVKCLSIILVGLYVKFLYDAIFEWYAYTPQYFIRSFIEYTIIGMICNFGLFFMTTKAAQKFKVWATIFYLPTFFITPMVVGNYLSKYIISGVIPFSGAIFIYYHLNPWRK